jgi:hypothetical protein
MLKFGRKCKRFLDTGEQENVNFVENFFNYIV